MQPAGKLNERSVLSAPRPVVAEDDRPTVIHAPRSGWIGPNARELWHYRELLYFLMWRDIKVRYKQTVIGAAWAILQPLLTMIVFSVVFGHFLDVPSDGIPYPVFAYAGLLPWTFFSTALARAGGSLVYDANLLSKVYFPRLIVPAAAIMALLVDFAIAFSILIGLMLAYDVSPGFALLALPLFTLLAIATTLGAGLWLAALNVKFRDVGYVVPFLTQFWLFITPVLYPSTVVPEQWRGLLGLNPMAGVVEGFRWALTGDGDVSTTLIAVSISVALFLVVTGIAYFRRMEDQFADIV